MSIKINFDTNNLPENPTLILAHRNGDKIDKIIAENIIVKDSMINPAEITFSVRKFLDNKKNILWDKIVDFKLVWYKEADLWFEAYVDIDEANETIKNVSCTQLGQAELSQIMLFNIEINTENDIARDQYLIPTVLYNIENTEASLLHRIMEKAPHYSIAYVDSTIKNIQRTFTFDNTSIYDAFQQIAEEIGCLFVFNSCSDDNGKVQRTISVYDLQSNCRDCGHRGEFTNVCPECNSSNINEGYGEDTTIFITPDELAEDIQFTTDTGSVKNCFKLEAGDDLMTATIRNCNPNGTDYIWHISDNVKTDMSKELVNKLESYDTLYSIYQNDYNVNIDSSMLSQYNNLVKKYQTYNEDLQLISSPIKGYPALMTALYNTIDLSIFLESALMPDATMEDTNATAQAILLTVKNLSPVAVTDVSNVSLATANNAVLSVAKIVVDSRYRVKVNNSSLKGQTWTGNFTVTNYSDEEDTAISSVISVVINDDYENFVKQKLNKAIKEKDTEDLSITGLFKMDYNTFCNELKKYSLNCLNSFYDACQACIDILIEQGIANSATWSGSDPNLYNDLYIPYYQKLKAIESELKIRQSEISLIDGLYDSDGILTQNGLQPILNNEKEKIQKTLDFENYIGNELWLEFCSYRREDKYSNDNYISDGLSNSELFDKALEFIKVARNEIYKSAELQHSISSSLKNLLVMEKFKPLTKYFKTGNWIRIIVDDNIYKLRLLEYEIDFSNIDSLSVDFSDVLKTANGESDQKSIISKVTSMTSSYDSVQKQATQGSKSNEILNTWFNDGLDATLTKIIGGADNQSQTWDSHGMLFRKYNSITDNYDDTQLKIINSTIAITDDNWKTTKTAVGSYYYLHPETKKLAMAYGVNAETLVGKLILGEQLGIYNESGSLSFDNDGFEITNGTNSFRVNPNSSVLLAISNGEQDVFYIDENGKLHITGDGSGLDISSSSDITDLKSMIQETEGIVKSCVTESEFESKFNIAAESITSTVTSNVTTYIDDEVDNVNTSISEIKQQANKIQSTVSSVESNLQGQIEENKSSITQTAKDIRAEVSNEIAGVNSTITQTAKAIRSEVTNEIAGVNSIIEQTATGIRAEVSNIQIGGRNYILGTGTPYTAVGNGSRQWLFPWRCASVDAANSLFGKTVTISFDCDVAITSGEFHIQIGTLWWGVRGFNSSTPSGHFTWTRAIDAATVTDDVFIYIDGTWTGSVTFSNMKVEIGNKETDWTPAPEDAEGAISKVSSELALMPDKIRMAVEGVEIGGRNLLRDADLVINNGWLDNNALNWHCRNRMRIGFGATGVDTTKDRSANFEEIYISPGDYTISFYAWKWNVDTNPTLYFDLKSADRVFEHNVIATKLEDTAKGGSVKKYTGTLRVESYNGKVKPRFVITDTFSSGDIGITEWKLERGNKATDWSPAPEDTDAVIAEVSAELVTQAGEIKAAASKIENLQIGGTNLLKDSKGLTTWSYSVGNKTWRYDDPSGFARFQMTESGQTADTWHMVRTPVTQLPSGWYGRQITLSAYIWSENFAGMDAGGHNPIDWTLCLSKGTTDRLNYGGSFPVKPGRVELNSDFSSDVPLGNYKWVRVSKTWTLNETDMSGGSGVFTDNTHVFVQFLLRRNGSYRVYAPKLEFGNKATDWSPSPDDTDGNLSAVSRRVTTVEQSVSALDEAIKSKVSTETFNAFGQTVSNNFSEVTQTATNINNRVTNEVNGLQAQINTNAEGILLQAGKKSGGTQLLKNGGFYGGLSNWSKLEYNVNGEWRNLYVEAPTPDNQYRSQEAPNLILHAQYETGMFGAAQVVKGLRKNTQYTISGYVASHRCNRAGIEIRDTTASRWAMNPVFDVGWGGTNLSAYNRFEYTFDTGDYSDYQITLYSNNFQDNAYVWWAQIKLEEGNTATAWSPHPDDPASGVDAGGVVRVDQTGVHMSGGTIEMETTDGDEYIHIRNDGISASSLSAPNVAKRYSGPTGLYVNPNATSAQIAAGNYFRSISDALATINNRMLDYNVGIAMASGMSDYTDAVISGVYGDGAILIYGENATVYGTVTVRNSHAQAIVSQLNVAIPSGVERAAYEVRNAFLTIYSSTMSGNNRAFTVDVNGYLDARSCVFKVNNDISAYVLRSTASFEDCIGNGYMLCHRGNMTAYGKVPIGNVEYWESCVPNNVSSLVPTGTDGTPAAPVISTVTYNYTSSDSYRGGWSYFDTDAPRQGFNGMDIYGTIWFDAAAIRSALSGKTIKQASLRLFMVKGVGRGRSVVVQLHGTNMGYNGRSGRPELTTSYGTIGTTEPDMNNEMTIPTAAINDIVSGRIQALVLKSDDTDEYKDKFYSENYARFEGGTSNTTADNCPRLTVVYQ